MQEVRASIRLIERPPKAPNDSVIESFGERLRQLQSEYQLVLRVSQLFWLISLVQKQIILVHSHKIPDGNLTAGVLEVMEPHYHSIL